VAPTSGHSGPALPGAASVVACHTLLARYFSRSVKKAAVGPVAVAVL
jgi:hypothetical protein